MLVMLLRHAHRVGFGDTSLSATGLAQAQSLANLLSDSKIPTPTRILTSPKKRAKETMEPLAVVAKLSVRSDVALDERADGEIPNHFQDRVSEFWERLTELKPEDVIYLCSHLDWLEASGQVVPGLNSMPFENARPILIEFADEKWRLK